MSKELRKNMSKEEINEILISELKKRGYNANIHEVVKNDITLQAIVIHQNANTYASPTIYYEKIINDAFQKDDLVKSDDIVEIIINIYEKNKELKLPFEISKLREKEFILPNVRIGFKLPSEKDDEMIKRPSSKFEGVEEYLFIVLDEYSININKGFMEIVNISEQEFWNIALQNTKKDVMVENINALLADLLPEEELISEIPLPQLPMWVVSNRNRFKGAAAILNEDVLKYLSKITGTKTFHIVLSSIHEAMVFPITEEFENTEEELSSLVKEINHSTVSPFERLVDRAFVFSVE